jgi:predicted TIM-barrel fold metal-dependent hydrolase
VLGCCGAKPTDGSNAGLAQYVSRNADRIIGIAGIDPIADGAIAQASALLDRKEFGGLVISPSGQGFHPADSRAMNLYELAQRRGVPVFFHHDIHSPAGGKMEYARPALLDEIALAFPTLTLVVPTLGYPWVDECIVLIGKNPRVFADIAGLMRRCWPAYNALLSAYQFGMMDKLLFGSDFTFSTAAETIEAVYRLNELTQGTRLPCVPREALRQVVQRDALACLGIRRPGQDPDKNT